MLHMSGTFLAGKPRQWKFWLYTAVCLFGAGLHAMTMLVMVLQNRPKVDWYFKEGGLASPVQLAVVWIDARTGTSLWGWIPIMFYRVLFSEGTGIRVRLSLERSEGDLGRVQPGLWLGRAWMCIATILALGGIFTPMWLEDDTTLFRLAGAMRSKPFGYIAAPAFLAAVVFLAASIALTVVQQRLLDGKTSWPLVWVGMAWSFSTFGCLLIVLEEERFTQYFFLASCISAAVWILILTSLRDRFQMGTAYVSVMVFVLLAVVYVKFWLLYYVYLALLISVRYVSVHESEMFLCVSKIEDPNEYVPLGSK